MGVIWGSRAAVDACARARESNRHIINLASMSSFSPTPGLAVYSATKHAVLGFSGSLQADLRGAGIGITVHSVCPDAVDTDMVRERAGDSQAAIIWSGPRMLTPSEVAGHVVELLDGKRLVAVIPRWRGWGARAVAASGRPGLRTADLMRRWGERQRARGLGFSRATKEERRAGDDDHTAGAGRGGRQRPARLRHRGQEPGHRRAGGVRAGPLGRRRAGRRRAGPRRPAGLGGARLRGPRPHPQAGAEVDARQLRPHRPHHRLRERQGLRGRLRGRDRLHGGRLRLLGQERAQVPGRREDPLLLALRSRAQARDPLRARRGGGRDRPLELPAHQLVRRLHPGAGRGQLLRAQAGEPHAAHLAADGRGPARVRPARGRVHRGARAPAAWARS